MTVDQPTHAVYIVSPLAVADLMSGVAKCGPCQTIVRYFFAPLEYFFVWLLVPNYNHLLRRISTRASQQTDKQIPRKTQPASKPSDRSKWPPSQRRRLRGQALLRWCKAILVPCLPSTMMSEFSPCSWEPSLIILHRLFTRMKMMPTQQSDL